MSKPSDPRADFSHFMLQCNDAAIRELAWVVGSEPLLFDASESHLLPPEFFQSAWQERLDWLRAMDDSPEQLAHLHAHLESGSNRLGKRFERLIEFWFEHHPHWTIQQSNWVISDSERTLGEFDLIALNEETGEQWHFELACKFYLSTRPSKNWRDWKGTNVQDDLQQKMDKLNQQVQLSDHPAAQERLQTHGITIQRRATWLKGWFFHHFRDMNHPIQPRLAHRHCNVGWWCTQSEWRQWMSPSAGDWLELSSLEWLQPVHSIQHAPMKSTQLLERWDNHPFDRHQMLAQVIHSEGKFIEVSRGFVVHDHWPALSRGQ